jgi:uncharacterized membrane protein
MGFCRSCGQEVSPGQGFCGSCGARAHAAGEAVAANADAATVVQAAAPMATNVVGALSYLAGFVTGIIFLVIDPYKNDSFVRFHAYQSIFFNVAWVAFWIVWMVVSAILTPLTAGIFGLIAIPLILIFTLTGLGCWIFLMYQAYQQKLFRLPVIGRFAAQQAGVRP